ncbi:sensor domain-containing diguanylate cyclase [Alteromonas gilva]|uniref:diguanylate cyclase n=1 Tax=Alteromonas gilva TaxID=2987522 RepID=A0ABT5L4S3_9ALTE|nr:diguanylate cyclase [Alteromonas gilva]MDC8832047.1 GGDEF domain-containing protein [Alteromonas gilva]
MSTLCMADCRVVSPQSQWLDAPVEVNPEFTNIRFRCELSQSQVLSFPLDAISSVELHTKNELRLTPLSSARAAYLLPNGMFEFALTVRSAHPSAVNITLRSISDFQRINNLHILTISTFGGFCLALCIYVGFIGRSLRNAGFYAYSAYILCAGAYFILQEGMLRIVFVDSHWLHSHELKSVFAGLTVFTAMRFICLLLDLKLILKRWEYKLIWLSALGVLTLGIVSAITDTTLHNVTAAVMGPLTIIGMTAITIAACYAYVRKVHGAGLVLMALFVLLAAMTFRIFLPYVSEFMQRYALILAVTLEALLLALAASERVKRLQKDKMKAFLAASSDPLCPVLNRRGWDEAANGMLAAHADKGGVLVLMFIDLNDFKGINDNFGHQVGDEALIIVAKILNRQSRAQDIVGRLGGDEFVIMSHCHNRTIAERLIKRIREHMKHLALKINDQHIPLSASVGAQIFDAPHDNLQTLLHEVDMLMYQQKSSATT